MALGAQILVDRLLTALPYQRQVHSKVVADKAGSLTALVTPRLGADLVTAATLHDIGYAHPSIGFHPVDGARFLADQGFSRVVCHLVAHHSASSYEAEERGIDSDVFREFSISADSRCDVSDIGRAHAILWWADMTTGPGGEEVTVEERLAEIVARYGPGDPVTRFVARARDALIAAGHLPIGSIQVPF